MFLRYSHEISMPRALRSGVALATLLLGVAGATFAAGPAVNGVSGTVSNGNSITVTGSGFGSTGPNVVVFDDFEGGTVGAAVKTGAGSAALGQWTTYSDNQANPYIVNSYHVSGSKAAQMNNNSNWKVLLQAVLQSPSTSVFWSYWSVTPTGSQFPGEGGLVNWKQVWAQGAAYNNDDFACPVFLGSSGWICAEDWGGGYSVYPGFQQPTKGSWTHYWGWLDAAPGGSTGHVQLWELRSTGIVQAANASNALLMPSGGAYERVQFNGNANSGSNVIPTFDDIYVAYGPAARARVEITNNATYTASSNNTICTTPAGAPGSAWSDGSITCTVRQGSFTSGQTAYVYVIDGSGNVSPGYKVTMGSAGTGGGGGTTPICGNSVKETGEVCDGLDLGGQTCTGLGFAGGTLSCSLDCKSLVTSSCTAAAVCGNNKKEAGETCDGTDLGGQTCTGLGFSGGSLSCSSDCKTLSTSSCTTSSAAPTITGVSGTLTHGQQVTLTGSGFKAKTQSAPLAFEDFRNCALTANLSQRSVDTVAATDSPRTSHSSCTARADFKTGDGYKHFSYDDHAEATWFVQYWVKLANNWHWGTSTASGQADSGLANVKFTRFFPIGSRDYPNVGFTYHGWEDSILFAEQVGQDTYTYDHITGWNLGSMSLGTWHLIQVEYRENSANDKADGVERLFVDGVLRKERTDLVTNKSSEGPWIAKRPFNLGMFDSWPPSKANVANMYAWYDGIYVDNTWQRIEVCDSANWASRGHCEIQKPKAWSDSSISFEVNGGSFADGSSKYLFVVDPTGTPSSAYPVTLGGTGGGGTNTPPATPTNLLRTDKH